MVESWCCFCMLLSMLRTFRRPSGDFRRVVRHCRKWHSYNGKISRCLQIFVLRILAGMGASVQSCQLSPIIRETPGFEPFLLVYNWSCRSLPFLVDSTMKFQMFCVFWAILLQSTPPLRTPRYYGHPAITDRSKIPGESYRCLTEIKSRYYGLSLLRTYRHFIRSQRHNFIVFSLVIADTEQHLGIFAHISSLFFLLFETVFVFFGRFPLLLSISQNSLIFFSFKAWFFLENNFFLENIFFRDVVYCTSVQ